MSIYVNGGIPHDVRQLSPNNLRIINQSQIGVASVAVYDILSENTGWFIHYLNVFEAPLGNFRSNIEKLYKVTLERRGSAQWITSIPLLCLVLDTDYIFSTGYIYVGGVDDFPDGSLKKLLHSPDVGYSIVVEVSTYGTVSSILVDADYLYIGCLNNIQKINKLNLNSVESINVSNTDVLTMAQDASYIYCCGSTDNTKVYKIQKSDMAKVDESDDYPSSIYSIAVDDDFIYCGGDFGKVYKIQKSDMAKIDESIDLGPIFKIVSSGYYIYCGGETQKVQRLRKDNLIKLNESPDLGEWVTALYANPYDIYENKENTRSYII